MLQNISGGESLHISEAKSNIQGQEDSRKLVINDHGKSSTHDVRAAHCAGGIV